LPVLEKSLTQFVPFLVTGSSSSGTVVHRAPYRNWTLSAWSHFRYRALPVAVRSFVGPRTGTGLYACCPISSTELCQFRRGRLSGPVPELDYVRWVQLLEGFVGVCARFTFWSHTDDLITTLTITDLFWQEHIHPVVIDTVEVVSVTG